ncbi:MAG: glutathione S-transferase family protein [Nitrospiraceae bacterium]
MTMTATPAKAQFPREQQDGAFVRQGDAFNEWVSSDGSTPYPAASGRYHLYVSWACPWAHRIILARQLLGLTEAISLSAVDPIRDERGWAFRDGPGHGADPVNGFAFLSEAYRATDPAYNGRVTVPVLWDRVTHRIVSNSDDDLLRMLNGAFRPFATTDVDLYPMPLRAEIDRLNAWLYDTLNDGVYRAGFATSQSVYEQAARTVFRTLDDLEARLAASRYLCGERPVESDWRLFVTLVRFDAVYHGHFKCNSRKIAEYPNLFGYLRDLYQQPGVAATVNMDHITRHYYVTHDDLNPTRIVPIGPQQDLSAPHDRARLSRTNAKG